jgi:hypothetical protein
LAGISFNQQTVNETVGEAFRSLKVDLSRLADIKDRLDSLTQQDLEGIGMTPTDAATVKSALADFGQLYAVFTGQATLAQAKDFQVFMRRCWGLGVR